MPKWEYAELWANFRNSQTLKSRIQFSHHEGRDLLGEDPWGVLRALGDEGWEIVDIHRSSVQMVFFFKRPQEQA